MHLCPAALPNLVHIPIATCECASARKILFLRTHIRTPGIMCAQQKFQAKTVRLASTLVSATETTVIIA